MIFSAILSLALRDLGFCFFSFSEGSIGFFVPFLDFVENLWGVVG